MLLKTPCLKYLAVFLSDTTLLPNFGLLEPTRIIESDALDVTHHGEYLRVAFLVQRRFRISSGLDPPTPENLYALLYLYPSVNSI